MPSDPQVHAASNELPLPLQPPSRCDPVDEDRDPVCTDEYVLYARALRQEALARRRCRRVSS